jgi:hypothetical protein
MIPLNVGNCPDGPVKGNFAAKRRRKNIGNSYECAGQGAEPASTYQNSRAIKGDFTTAPIYEGPPPLGPDAICPSLIGPCAHARLCVHPDGAWSASERRWLSRLMVWCDVCSIRTQANGFRHDGAASSSRVSGNAGTAPHVCPGDAVVGPQ